jgi:flagellar P-ring protein precursor FlgI
MTRKFANFGLQALVTGICCFSLIALTAAESAPNHQVMVRDLATVSGVRENPLIGYGVVVGLKRTGDSQQTLFTTQTLANVLLRMGVQIAPAAVQVRNVAAVMVTASLPSFARPGTTFDVTVSSVGDAKSLEGGVLLLTAMHASDGAIYAEAQGPLTLGGYTVGGGGNSKAVNHVTVGRIPAGATVERDTSFDLSHLTTVSLVLREPDFTAARDVTAAINQDFGKSVASFVDSRRVDVDVAQSGIASVPLLISRVQNLAVLIHPPAKVVMNERTGTIVMGGDVKLSPVSVLHGDLTVEVTTAFIVSQPAPFAKVGKTEVVPQTDLEAKEGPARSIALNEGASVEELINGLHAMGATAHDIVAILQAIKAAGGLQAELEVL